MRLPCLSALALLLSTGLARADGEYLQFDLGPTDSTAVGSLERSGLSTGFVWSRYTDGGSIGVSTTLSRPIEIAGRAVTLRYGPTLRFDGEFDLGAKVVAESYVGTDWGGVFLIGEISSIDLSYFAMIEANRSAGGLSFAAVATGDNDGYSEQSFVLSKALGQSDWRLRLGYRLGAREVFLGVSLNTF